MNGKRSMSWWALVALPLASAACGGSGGDSPEAKADDRAGASSTSSSSAKEGGGASSDGGASGGPSAPDGPGPATDDGTASTTSSTSSTSAGAKGSKGSEAKGMRKASIDRTCVRRGVAADVQGLTVRNMKPEEFMSYATVYSDGSTKFSNRSYETGEGSGKAGPDGVYRATWVVPATAPLGEATVRLVTFEQVDPMDLTFTIVGPQETCP